MRVNCFLAHTINLQCSSCLHANGNVIVSSEELNEDLLTCRGCSGAYTVFIHDPASQFVIVGLLSMFSFSLQVWS